MKNPLYKEGPGKSILYNRWLKTMLLPLSLTCVLAFPLSAQDRHNEDARKSKEAYYGPDCDLINGEKYTYPYLNSEGTPFFLTEEFEDATLSVDGSVFSGQRLRYDIYNHIVILDYMDLYGSQTSIVLRNRYLEYFKSRHLLFKRYERENGSTQFGQVIHEDSISCIYFWSKDRILGGESTYRFTEPQRESVLLINNAFLRYRNNRSFLKIFAEDQRTRVKQYLRDNHVKVRKAGTSEMQLLLEFINSWTLNEG